MKYLWLALILVACSSKQPLPEAVASPDAAAKLLPGKTWTVTRSGIVSPFATDGKRSYEWLDEMKEVDDLSKNAMGELAALQVKFVNDSLASITGMPDAPADQKYGVTVDEDVDTSAPILQFTYEGESLFGNGERMMLTYSYPIYGINDKSMVLGTPRSVNNRAIVLLLEANKL